MTDLRRLLAANLKHFRGEQGLSQAKLAEKAATTTHYVGMIEIARHFPSPEMLEQIAGALGIDVLELFSVPSPPGALKRLQKEVLRDVQAEAAKAAAEAVEQAVRKTVSRHIAQLEEAPAEG
ncbi:MAG: helix-turn-helix transcriptional regulator [Treponematales bacterium]